MHDGTEAITYRKIRNLDRNRGQRVASGDARVGGWRCASRADIQHDPKPIRSADGCIPTNDRRAR